ncbi:Type IV leader peptidase family protein [uncultured archaeon]|nr:Type IV leader peptidase family protein [uncultured archaeon]
MATKVYAAPNRQLRQNKGGAIFIFLQLAGLINSSALRIAMDTFVAAYLALSLGMLGIASYTDIKTRLVHNRLLLGALAIGIALKATESFLSSSVMPLGMAIGGGITGFAIGYLLYRIGAWAGGDVKLLAVLCTINPVNYAAFQGISIGAADFAGFGQALAGLTSHGTWMNGLPLFGVSMAVFSALAVFPLGLLMSFSAAFSHRDVMEKASARIIMNASGLFGAATVYSGTALLLQNAPGFFAFAAESGTAISVIPLLIAVAWAFMKGGAKWAVAAALFAAGIFFNGIGFAADLAVLCLPLFALYSLWALYASSRKYAFREMKKSTELQEGDVPDAMVLECCGKIEVREAPSLKSVIKKLIDNRVESCLSEMKPKGRVIADPRSAGGLEEKEAAELRKLALEGKIPAEIPVRKTMAFVPAMLLAYILLQITGDFLWNALGL